MFICSIVFGLLIFGHSLTATDWSITEIQYQKGKLDVPGFAFFNSDLTAYIDDSAGIAQGGAPTESNSWMLDFNWAYPFSIDEQDFSI